jgi:preprotein translocase subunit YajC
MEARMFAIWLQSASGGLGSLGGLALPVLFFVVLYFLMIVPNQRKQKKWQEMLGQIKSGDRVTTNGGIRGTVLTVKDDSVILRVQPDGIKLEFVKSAIAAVTTEEQAAA